MFSRISPAVKNLIIINVLIVFGTWIIYKNYNLDINNIFGLYYYQSPKFHIWQYFTYMFMHAPLYENWGIMHVFFNMYALFMFGTALEQVWGSKRFLTFYFVTGIGATLFYTFINHLEYIPMIKDVHAFINTPSPELLRAFINDYLPKQQSRELIAFMNQWAEAPKDPQMISESISFVNSVLSHRMDVPCIGASGAVYGVLLGFGMLFPNTQLMFIFPPIPIKAKYVVLIYGGIELYLSISQPGSQVAHVAHVGGMIFGYFLIKLWNKNREQFY